MKRILLTTILGLISISGFSQGSSKKGSWSTANMALCKEEMQQMMQDLKVDSLEKFVVCFCKELEKSHDSYFKALVFLEENKNDQGEMSRILADCAGDDGVVSESGNCIDGHGKVVFSSGASYEGDFKNGLPHGKGIFIYADESQGIYEGSFQYGMKHGEGILTINGMEGLGTWKNDKKNGEFIFRMNGKIVKRATFSNDLLIE